MLCLKVTPRRLKSPARWQAAICQAGFRLTQWLACLTSQFLFLERCCYSSLVLTNSEYRKQPFIPGSASSWWSIYRLNRGICLSHSLLRTAAGGKKTIRRGKASPAIGHKVSGCSGWFSLVGPNGHSKRLKWDFVSTCWRSASQQLAVFNWLDFFFLLLQFICWMVYSGKIRESVRFFILFFYFNKECLF